jgi:hypothetical protein
LEYCPAAIPRIERDAGAEPAEAQLQVTRRNALGQRHVERGLRVHVEIVSAGKERRALDARLQALHEEARLERVRDRVRREWAVRVEPVEVEVERRPA